jgi:diphthine synthase
MVLYFIGLGLGDEKDITVKGLEIVRYVSLSSAPHGIVGGKKMNGRSLLFLLLLSFSRSCLIFLCSTPPTTPFVSYSTTKPLHTHKHHFERTHTISNSKCKRVFLEAYTAILGVDREKLQAFYECEVLEADRDLVEQGAEQILRDAATEDIAFLVVGDPFGATTHTDLYVRARDLGIPCQVVHNASIMNAVGACGLQLYNYGQCVSICFFNGAYRPDSFYEKIAVNAAAGLHTLCLLDIKVKEQNDENLAKGIKVFEPPRYMSVTCCVEQLLEVEAARGEKAYTPESPAFGMARVGQSDQIIISGSLAELAKQEFGPPLHSLVVCGKMHFIEEEMFEFWHCDRDARKAARAAATAEDTKQREAERLRVKQERAERIAKRKADKAAGILEDDSE